MSATCTAQLSLLLPLGVPGLKQWRVPQNLSCFPKTSKLRRSERGRRSSGNGVGNCRAQLLADFAPTASAAYGVLLLGGGLFAYTRSKSKRSAIGGLSGSALMALAYYLMQLPETKVLGDALGFGSALLFTAIFGIRLITTRKVVPSGLLLGVSFAAVAVLSSAYLADKASLGF